MNAKQTDVAAALARTRIFAGVDAGAMADIAAQVHVFDAHPGQVIIQFGDTDDDVFFLISGRVIGQMVSESGREVMFAEMEAGACFGELAALDGQARSLTVSARQAAVLARLGGAAFNAIIRDNPVIATNLALELARRIRLTNERVFGLVVHDVEMRVRLYLLRLAQEQGKLSDGAVLDTVPTHEQIATFVGANREAVTRAIAKLGKAGMIKASRGKITIRDCDLLLSDLDIAGPS